MHRDHKEVSAICRLPRRSLHPIFPSRGSTLHPPRTVAARNMGKRLGETCSHGTIRPRGGIRKRRNKCPEGDKILGVSEMTKWA